MTNKFVKYSVVAFMSTSILAGLPAVSQAARERISLDAGWKFSTISQNTVQNNANIDKWEWIQASDNPKLSNNSFDFPKDNSDWITASLHEDTFKGRIGYNWYRTTLPALAGKDRVLRCSGVDDNADVFLNGVHLYHQRGYNVPFAVGLDSHWNADGPNVLLILIENTGGGGGICGDVAIGNDPVFYNNLTPPSASAVAQWRTVNLPHDYVIEQPFTAGVDPQHASLPSPRAWYSKTIAIPENGSGKSYWLDFDGIYRDAIVFINGKQVAQHASGYTPLHLDITGYAKPGKALTIDVHVDPSFYEGWWYEGGGIYRHVWLTSVAPVHIAHEGVQVIPVAVGDEAKPASAKVDVHVTLENSKAAAKKYSLIAQITDPKGKVVAEQKVNSARPLTSGTTVESVSLSFAKPALWSIEKPNLYKLHTSLVVNNQVVDQAVTSFGVRTVRFDADKGFFLNGKPVKIKGVCNHQDFAGIGNAVSDNLQYWRVKKMQSIGANAWRMSHNPPNPELLDACDELGMLVLDENRHFGDTYVPHTQLDTTPADDLSDLASMVIRDRNHPSIIAWSLCNEEPLQGTHAGAEILKKMMACVRKLDSSRLITCAMNHEWGKGFSDVVDIQGCNYQVETNGYDNFHRNFPNKPMLSTESSSAVQDRGMYSNDWGRSYIGDYTDFSQEWLNWIRRTEEAWTWIADREFIAGTFIWTGFDYKGEPSPFAWPNVNSHYGVLDMCGFPKDMAYYYKVYWSGKPAVHITPHWNWPGKEGQPIKVTIFSSAPKVDLLLNGVSLGQKDCPFNGHAEWTVNYQPGTLLANAYDAHGKLAASDTVVTSGKPYRLELRTDLPKVRANGQDMSVIEASIVDEAGHFVSTASDKVTFTVTGDTGFIAGTGNGDPNNHTSDTSISQNAFNGRLAAVIKSTGKPGSLKITATADGLQASTITVQFK